MIIANRKDEPKRDFIGYADQGPNIEWPDGSRLAVNFVINYEEGSERNRADGDPDLEPLTESFYAVPPEHRELISESIYEFGSRVGIWRLLQVFDRYHVKPTIFACGLALERNPRIAAAFAERDLDIVGHGYRWVSHFGMSPEQERHQIRRAVEAIRDTTGRRIQGWYTRPPITTMTRQVLAEEGFLYDSSAFNDDVPYFSLVAGRPFLVVPYTLDVNDIRFWKTSMFNSADFASYTTDAFDYLRAESRSRTRLLSIGLHPRITGRAARMAGLERVLSHVTARGEAWLAGRTNIARHWARHFAPPETWNWPQNRLTADAASLS